MQTCQFYSRFYLPFILGELSPEEQEEFEGHLFECNHCQQEIKRLEELDTYLLSNIKYDISQDLPFKQGVKSGVEDITKHEWVLAADDKATKPEIKGRFPSIDFRYFLEVLLTSSGRYKAFLQVPEGEMYASRVVHLLNDKESIFITDNEGSFILEDGLPKGLRFFVDS